MLSDNQAERSRSIAGVSAHYFILSEPNLRKILDSTNFHTLRHTFTTRCIEQGMDILAVARTLGHADIKMTLNRYSHLLPQHMRASMAMMEDHYY